MFRSAVFKLTAAYAAMAMAICILFSILLYNVAVSEIHHGLYNEYSRWFRAYEPFGLRNPGGPAGELAIRAGIILRQIIYFNVLMLLLTTLVSYWLARRTLRPIEQAHEQQKRFTADVSHELRTPLTAIRMESEVSLLDPKASAEDLRDALASNLEEVGRMEALINNLLLISTMEANKLRTHFQQQDVAVLMKDALNSVKMSASEKDIRIRSKLAPSFIQGDRTSLTQLFIILLENAVKYSPSGTSIDVGVRRTKKGRVAVEINDKGGGIPLDALPHVFDRFYRADMARTSGEDKSQGFGLGLSLAKVIADLHNSEIVITSTEGVGTKVSVLLPQIRERMTSR